MCSGAPMVGKARGGSMTLCGGIMYRSGGAGRGWCVADTFIAGPETGVEVPGDWDDGAEIEYIGTPNTAETSGFAAVGKVVEAKFGGGVAFPPFSLSLLAVGVLEAMLIFRAVIASNTPTASKESLEVELL